MEIIKKNVAEATDSDFLSCGGFHRLFFFFLVLFLFNEFPPGMPAGSRYEYATLLF